MRSFNIQATYFYRSTDLISSALVPDHDSLIVTTDRVDLRAVTVEMNADNVL